MVETTAMYTTDEERKSLIEREHANGFWIKHDDFNIGPNGENKLTFTNVENREPTTKDTDTYIDELIDLFPNAVLNASGKTAAKEKLRRIVGTRSREAL